MQLDEARKVLTNSVLHVGESDYGNAKLDRALKFVLQIFLRETRCDTTLTNFAMTANSATQDVTDTLNDFLPYQVISARIDYKKVELRNSEELVRKLDESTSTGRPTMMGWETKDSALVYPIPDEAYTLAIARTAPLIAFDAGTEKEIELNVPEPFIHDAIWFGASSALVHGESGNLYASEGWRRFEQLIFKVASLASMGVPGYQKDLPYPSLVNRSIEGASFQLAAW